MNTQFTALSNSVYSLPIHPDIHSPTCSLWYQSTYLFVDPSIHLPTHLLTHITPPHTHPPSLSLFYNLQSQISNIFFPQITRFKTKPCAYIYAYLLYSWVITFLQQFFYFCPFPQPSFLFPLNLTFFFYT